MQTKISAKGWVVIPRELRKRYGLGEGTSVRFVDYGGVLSIFPVSRDPIQAAFGMLKEEGLTEALLQERRWEREREER